MSVGSSRRPRCIGAKATYLNAGLWGSRFVGECEVSTNGERVWLKGHRIPAWMAWARVLSYVTFVPVGFFTGILLAETVLGRRGYPPYYYLASALLTFLLVVLGLWGAGIWTENVGAYESVSWPAPKGRSAGQIYGRRSARKRTFWAFLNKSVNANGHVQVEVPIGPNGKPRRLVLKTEEAEARSLISVMSGVYYGQADNSAFDPADPWRWSRN